MKEYGIYCITKANGQQYLHHALISAENVKAAKDLMKHMIETDYDRHAFSIGTKPSGSWDWEYILNNRGMTIEQVTRLAESKGGWQITNY